MSLMMVTLLVNIVWMIFFQQEKIIIIVNVTRM